MYVLLNKVVYQFKLEIKSMLQKYDLWQLTSRTFQNGSSCKLLTPIIFIFSNYLYLEDFISLVRITLYVINHINNIVQTFTHGNLLYPSNLDSAYSQQEKHLKFLHKNIIFILLCENETVNRKGHGSIGRRLLIFKDIM